MTQLTDWRLFHLADSGLPTGAYAFSNGLEAAAKVGLIRTSADLEDFVRGSVRQLYGNELAFVQGAFQLSASEGDAALLLAEYDATVLIPEMRRASLTLGGTWLRLMNDLYGTEQMEAAESFLALSDHRHFVCVFGATMRAAGYVFEDAMDLLVYSTVRDLVSSAIRLGLIGPSRGHILIHELCGADERGAGLSIPHWRCASRCFPLLEFTQAAHASLYSRLFQN